MLSIEEKEKLSENGKFEVVEIEVEGKKAVIVADFTYISKAVVELIDTKVSGKGKNATVDVKMNHIGAGDFLLFQCWHSGDAEIKTVARLRMKACKKLGDWVQQFADDEDETEKKS
jgi:hypothetical protein